MKAPSKYFAPLFALPLLACGWSHAQDPAHATEFRMQQPGNGPGGVPRIAFLSHRLGTDHAEGISMLDMNGDGFLDLLSGAYCMRTLEHRGESGSSISFAPSAFTTSSS